MLGCVSHAVDVVCAALGAALIAYLIYVLITRNES